MAKESKTEFERWINSIPIGDYPEIRKQIMEATGVSRVTFSAWQNGKSTPSFENKALITRIAHEYDQSCPFAGWKYVDNPETGVGSIYYPDFNND